MPDIPDHTLLHNTQALLDLVNTSQNLLHYNAMLNDVVPYFWCVPSLMSIPISV